MYLINLLPVFATKFALVFNSDPRQLLKNIYNANSSLTLLVSVNLFPSNLFLTPNCQ